jgi:hypothetical protein
LRKKFNAGDRKQIKNINFKGEIQMKKVNFELGQEVVIEGKFVNTNVWGYEVEEAKKRIEETGVPEISHKYEVEKFEETKFGIVVGVRSIVASRIHYLNEYNVIRTKILRQPALLVACDLRGTILVPVNMAYDHLEWVVEFGEDITAEVLGATV